MAALAVLPTQGMFLVGARGFEPRTPCAQGRCATRLRYAPTVLIINEIACLSLDLPRYWPPEKRPAKATHQSCFFWSFIRQVLGGQPRGIIFDQYAEAALRVGGVS